MKAILLAAGIGSRLRPLTHILPKCLLPINGRPLLEYWLSLLIGSGNIPILVNLHHLSHLMKKWIENSAFNDHVYTVYEETLLGTGGTLLKNMDFADNSPVILIHADNLCSVDIKHFIEAHQNRPHGTEITMMTFKTSSPETCGIVDVDEDGIVRAFYEKVKDPPGDMANAAVYIIEPSVIDFLKGLGREFIDFSTDVIPYFVERHKIFTYYNASYHRDIGNKESYLKAQIEYPINTDIMDEKNAWLMLCRDYDISEKMALTISSAFNVEALGIEEFERYAKTQSHLRKFFPIFCPFSDENIDRIKSTIKKNRIKEDNVLIIFSEVPQNFSSYRLHRDSGLKSIGICYHL